MLAGFVERRTLFACMLATGAIFVDIAIVNVVIPDLRADLGTTLAEEQWIVNAYLVTMTAFVLPAGVMGDLYGHKRMLQIGLALFAVATLFVGLAPTPETEIAARALQGFAAALMTPASMAILRTSIAPERQARAVGLWVTGTSLSSAIAPAFGGVIGGLFGWRWAFLVVIPGVLLGLWYSRGIVPTPRIERRVDVTGGIITAAGIGLLTAGLIESPSRGLGDPLVVALLVLAVAAGVLFVFHERRFPEPMIPARAIRDRVMNRLHVFTILAWSTPLAVQLLLSIRLQSALGLGPIATGFLLLPMSGMIIILSAPFTRWAARDHMRLMMRVGPALTAASCIPALLLAPGRVWIVVPTLVLLGIGMACLAGPVTHAVLQLSPPGDEGMQSAINLAAARFGSLLIIAMLGIAAAIGWTWSGGGTPPANPLEGGGFSEGAYQAGLILAAAVALAAVPFATAARRSRAAEAA